MTLSNFVSVDRSAPGTSPGANQRAFLSTDSAAYTCASHCCAGYR